MIFVFLWYISIGIQNLLNYGTAYRLTKAGGDNGASLFGWFFLLGLASLIPGLGIYLWYKYKDSDADYYQPYSGSGAGSNNIHQTPSWAKNPDPESYVLVDDSEDEIVCSRCNTAQSADRVFCRQCGLDFKKG